MGKKNRMEHRIQKYQQVGSASTKLIKEALRQSDIFSFRMPILPSDSAITAFKEIVAGRKKTRRN